MTIESDFRFAIFDRGRDRRILTQRRRGAKSLRVFGRGGFGCQFESGDQNTSDTFQLCALASLCLCVKPVKLVKAKAAKFAGLVPDFSWHPIWHYLNLGASYVQIKSDIFTSVHLWSDVGGKYFFNSPPKRPDCFQFTIPAGLRSRIEANCLGLIWFHR